MISLFLLFTACAGLDGQVSGYTGTIEVTEVEVASVLPGRLIDVRVDEGDSVAAGDVVFTLDNTAAEAERDLRASAIDVTRAAVDSAVEAKRAADAQVAYLGREVTRIRKMEEAGVGSPQQRSSLEGQLAVAKAHAAAAEQGVAQATAAVAQAEAGLRLAEKQLSETTVQATLGGVVLSRNREPGEVVAPGASVVTLGDTTRPRLRIYLPLTRVEALSLGDEVTVRIDASDTPITGTVSRIASKAEFTPREILTPEERVKRVFAVEIALPAGPGLLPGVPAEAELGG